jgi:hypothetical protein
LHVHETNRPDQVTDALISRGLVSVDGGGDCPDPSLLAGIHEGNLEPDETERWITHLAGCRHCQETLVALARAEDAAPPVHVSGHTWWQAPREAARRWTVLAPLAAAAVVVLAVWVTDPGSTTDRRPLDSTPGAAPITEPAVIATNQPALETSLTSTREPGAQPIDQAEEQLAVATADRAGDEPESVQALTLPPVAPPATVGGAAARARSDGAASAATAPQPRALARPAAAPQAAFVIGPVLIQSPQDAIQWRAEPSGEIERTDDGGVSWRLQLTVPEGVVAGAAPSTTVAWWVGEQGLVVRTLDGEEWSRLSPPAEATLIAIEAADRRRAPVPAADGRPFRTADAGTEWTLLR